ncbi:hypothetical protein HN858_03675 [Candidatus Falkowbacteria bacterium]|jgi:predicted transcriptional regulator|nr:hypothetical protein [Candidatus Falkowbacteria bacterium]MBT5503698.1 hypothetical protein [Candidatus Falkowbacteria bacterium]MBT6573822.1 hypothetical protein [Candidatus Falkowbacteria bacterium]MBT7348750.1 hypothetical protein [Candidatus Falkowbacteria bacterium]MBT7500540.1 hypothetical protein [Candidatus Falkowbacteria bacterium]
MLIKELQEFGLSDKESRVYLAALELGTSTIQELSQKSNVNRATTYIQVETLLKRGLLSTVDKNKKSVFIAERPDRLLSILDEQKQKIENKHDKIKKLIPDFEALYNVIGDRPRVRFFEGSVGVDAWRQDVYKFGPSQLDMILPLVEDFDEKSQDTSFLEKILTRVQAVRLLVPEEKRQFMNKILTSENLLVKYHKLVDFRAEMIIYSNKVYISKALGAANMAVLMEDKMFYKSFLAIYDVLWDVAEE